MNKLRFMHFKVFILFIFWGGVKKIETLLKIFMIINSLCIYILRGFGYYMI